MSKNIKLIKLINLDKITIDEKTYELNKKLSGNGGLSFKYVSNDDSVFIKFLIAPRNDIEINKFKLEVQLLESRYAYNEVVKTTPNLLDYKVHNTLPIYYYIAEWIEGVTLNQKLSQLTNPNLDEILDILHRCLSVAAYLTPAIAHRDFHPGNLIFLNDKANWDASQPGKVVDPKVIITDFGNAIMPIAFSYEDKKVDQMLIYQNVNRRIEGSFKSLPPEIFIDPIHAFLYNPGCGESWAIGILFYKLIESENIVNLNSISEYANLVCTNEIEKIISDKLKIIEKKLNNNYILIRIIKGLLKVKSSERMSPADAAGLFWDYRFGDLNEQPIEFQKKYIDSGRNYPPMRPDEYSCY